MVLRNSGRVGSRRFFPSLRFSIESEAFFMPFCLLLIDINRLYLSILFRRGYEVVLLSFVYLLDAFLHGVRSASIEGLRAIFFAAGIRYIVAITRTARAARKGDAGADIRLVKDLLYDKYTLEDVYPYKDTVRSFKWEVVNCLAYIENMQSDSTLWWVVMQNYKNMNREAPLVRSFVRNAYRRVADTLGGERYQSIPLYAVSDTLVPVRYGRDGTIAFLLGKLGSFIRLLPVTFEEEWLVPDRYIRHLPDSTRFHHVIFVDRNI